MTSSSSPRSPGQVAARRVQTARALAALTVAALLSGCWTGRVYERGRLRESVLAYDSARLERERIVLDYTVQVADWRGQPVGRARRAAAIPRAALVQEPEPAVDAFPLRPLPPGAGADADGIALPLVASAGESPRAEAPHLLLVPGAGGPRGFRLCDSADGCLRTFRSEALYRDRTAWWVYPLVPFAAALDAALLPAQALSLAPFFLLGD